MIKSEKYLIHNLAILIYDFKNFIYIQEIFCDVSCNDHTLKTGENTREFNGGNRPSQKEKLKLKMLSRSYKIENIVILMKLDRIIFHRQNITYSE